MSAPAKRVTKASKRGFVHQSFPGVELTQLLRFLRVEIYGGVKGILFVTAKDGEAGHLLVRVVAVLIGRGLIDVSSWLSSFY
jgi:hypothetical protein